MTHSRRLRWLPSWIRESRIPLIWRGVFALVCLLVALHAFLSMTSVPFASDLDYATIAPPGWSNISLHGKYTNANAYAVSPDVPGLMLAFGSTQDWLVSGLPWQSAKQQRTYWRSIDGGSQWTALPGPCMEVEDERARYLCALIALEGNAGTIFSGWPHTSYQVNGELHDIPGKLWVSHDGGVSWRALVTGSQDLNDDYFAQLRHALYRNGHLYMLLPSQVFSVSDDDGAIWRAVETPPSTFEPQHGTMRGFAPDYSNTNGWYRAVDDASGVAQNIVTLQHSADDGRTWTSLLSFDSADASPDVVFATNPAQPASICLAARDTNRHIFTLTSRDIGSHFQRFELSPTLLQGSLGAAFTGDPHMSKSGDCFVAEAVLRSSYKDDTALIWYITADGASAHVISSSREFTLKSSGMGYTFAFALGTTGKPDRLIVYVHGEDHPWRGWASITNSWSHESDDNLLL